MKSCWPLILLLAALGCAARAPQPPLPVETLRENPLWLAAVRNSTDTDLRLPGTNPLRSLAEMAGKVAPDYRPTLPDALRASIQRELERRALQIRFPEDHDARLSVLPFEPEAAARIARSRNLEGVVLLSEIRRWAIEAPGLMRLRLEFQLVRIADGALLWQRSVRRVLPAHRSGNPAETVQDALREVTRELF